MKDNKLHIKVLPTGNQTFNARDYVLTLPKAEEFDITILEFQNDNAIIQKEIEALEKQNREGFEWLAKSHKKKGEDGWSKKELTAHKANIRVRNKTQEETRDEIAALEKSLKEKYKDVVWVWSLYKDLSKRVNGVANKKIAKGLENGKKTRKFPKALEGGGYAWIEPFIEGTEPVGTPSFGCYVRALGTPKISSITWTDDLEGKNKITTGKFNQTVFLHIETEGLYGQDIRIYLMDDDYNPDDKIPATVKVDHFQREVSVFSKSGRSGISDNSHVQKVILKITIDVSWKQYFDDIDMYAKVIYKKNGVDTLAKGSSQLIIKGGKKVQAPEGNIAVVKGKIDTDVAEYHPCTYKKINVTFKEDDKQKSLTLYDDSKGESWQNELLYPIVAGNDQKRKKFTINVSDVETDECFFKNTPSTHKDHVIDISKLKQMLVQGKEKKSKKWRAGDVSSALKGGEVKTEKSGDMNDDREIDDSHIKSELSIINGVSNIKAQRSFNILEKHRPFKLQEPTDTKLELEVGFDYSFGGTKHPLLGLISTINPNADNMAQKYPITIESCARKKPLEIAVLPDSKWTVQLGFNYDKTKFNAVREAYHQKWVTRKLIDESALKKLEAKRINLQEDYMDDAVKVETLKKELGILKEDLKNTSDEDENKKIIKKIKKREKKLAKKIKKKENKLGKKWKKGVEKQNKKIKEKEAKLQKAKSKTSAKGKLSKAFDLMEPDDALENGLIDCQFSMVAEFDRPYGAIELSSQMDEITDFIKKIANIKEKIDETINGKHKGKGEIIKSKPKGINKRLERLKGNLDKKKSNWSFEFIPPSIGLSLSWHAERPKDLDTPVIGTMFAGVIDMNPLFGFEVKYDVYQLLYKIKHPAILCVVATLDLLDGALGDSFNINLDLIATTTFSGTLMGTANTASESKYLNRLAEDEDDTPAKFNGKLIVELKGEVNGKGTIDPLFFGKKTIYGGVEVSATSGVSIEFVTKADKEGLYIEPEVLFEGLILKAGVSGGAVNKKNEGADDEKEKSIEELKKETGLHYAAEGEIIIFDKYEWELANYRIPIYKF